MAELGGMLAAAILKVVSDQIGSAIGGQIKLQKNFEEDLKKMKMALESVDALLEDAGRRSVTDKSTLLWLKRLKDTMYVISDMIDEFESDTQPSARKFSFKKYLAIMIPCITIGPNITIANKMEKVRGDLEVITDQHRKFKLTEGTNTDEPKVTDIRETSSTLETQITGRTEEKEEILASLFESMTEEITILPIYGIGGLGKTTVAKMVYNSSQFKEYTQVWVYVSQTFDLKKIGNSIISQLAEKEERKHTEMQMIHNSLQKLLDNKKILIVLDDMWEGEESHLESLMDMLKVGKGSNVVVIVTTRDESIANKICTIQPYKLAPLTNDMCWSIMKQKSAFESRDDKEQLEKIGKVIAMKCAGVALAAKSLGHMLKSMKSGEWESVRDSDVWNVSSLKDTSSTRVLASLKMSYSVMPSYLKLCFAYCAIFPKGHKIVKDDLIHQWVSLGFSTWQLGETYISQLLGLSFLEHSTSTSTIELYDEDITLLTMHDLVHDLARSVMDDEILVVGNDINVEGSCYHYALLNDFSKPLSSESSKLRALRFSDCGEIELHGAAFSSAKSLRVLDLSECIIHKLPDSIGVLKQLRYLNAPRIQHATIPDSITRLSKLIYLNLHGSPAIMALPESIGEIEGLSYLDLSGCSTLGKLPESFGRLRELVHLDFSNCSCVGGISEFLESLTQLQYLNLSYCRNIGKLPEALGGLCKLRYLDLSFSSYLDWCEEAEVLGALNKLEYLNLSSEKCHLRKLPEALGRFIQLKYLNLSECCYLRELPRSFGSLGNLVHLDLSNCYSLGCLNEALVGLTNLQHLNLHRTRVSLLPDGVTKIRYLNLSYLRGSSKDTFHTLINHICSNLPDLEHLDLSGNFAIESIPESLCILRKLHTLNLSGCICLEKIPESICAIESLKFLYLNGCPFISKPPQLGSSAVSLPYFVVQPGNTDSGSNLVQLQQVDPAVLRISKLENVKSAAEAHHIKLMEKKRLYNLSLEWTEDVERFVDDRVLLEKLVPPCTLEKLEIRGYNGVSFPAWLVEQLPDLVRLVLRGMANRALLENLVPPSTLKELEICGYNGVSFPAWLVLDQLPELESLILRSMANLEEWNTSSSSGEEHVIQNLEIHDCPMLRIGPLPPKAKRWVISNSDNVLSPWEECTGPHTNATTSSVSPVPPSTLKELEIRGYNGVSFPAWLVLDQLPHLESLVLRDLAKLEEWKTSYSSGEEHVLWRLEIRDCPLLRMGPLPPRAKRWVLSNSDNVLSSWEECTSSFSSVTTELSVGNCKVPLHQWRLLQHFPGLTFLHIIGSVDLTDSPEVIRHLSSLETLQLQDKDLEELPKWLKENKGQLTKLQSLQLYNCNSMASLPHWLGELTSLKKLYLWHCAVLSSLPESIQQLTRLETLDINDCPELKCLVERGCLLPTSLEILEIWRCNGIKSLPEGMEQLTNLQKLDIRMCPELVQWCELEENKMKLAHIENKEIC